MASLFRVRAWDWEGWISVTVIPAEGDEDNDELETVESVVGNALTSAPRLKVQRFVDGEWEDLE